MKRLVVTDGCYYRSDWLHWCSVVDSDAQPETWRFEHLSLGDGQAMMALFAEELLQVVVNLTA